VYYDILLAAWSQYSGHKKRRLPYFLTFFSVGAGGAIQTTLFQCFCLELKSIFTAQNFIHIFGILLLPYVICKSHIDTS